MSNTVAISVIITCHSEGILLHKTLASVKRALGELPAGTKSEIILHADNPTDQMNDYIELHKSTSLLNVKVYKNSFGDLGASRNFAISKASGRYIATIDADDLMSKCWLRNALLFLESANYGEYVAHSAMTIEFGGSNSIVQKYGEINTQTDTLLSVWSGRWNSVIVAPADFMKSHPYQPNSPGYGYEDWHLSCSFIEHGLHNVTIPETVIFVRRKDTESEWARQKTSHSLLRAHPLLKLSRFRALPDNINATNNDDLKLLPDNPLSPSKIALLKNSLRPYLKSNPALLKAAKKTYRALRHLKQNPEHTHPDLPQWLLEEWRDLHTIEKLIYPDANIINSKIYHTITADHYRVGIAYKAIAQATRRDSYDYILLVPWLAEGGADLFAINYANYISSVLHLKVVVFATNPGGRESAWASRLNKAVDFVDFGTITSELSIDQQYRVFEQFLENTGAHCLHVLNSAFGYDFVRDHQVYLTATGKQIFATAYSQSIDPDGKVFGFSHTHVPQVYEQLKTITTDNQAVVDMWINEYGFDPKKMVVHHQPIDSRHLLSILRRDTLKKGQPFKILWASRLAQEKLPTLVDEIAEHLEKLGLNFQIDMYGTAGSDITPSDVAQTHHVSYKGGFNDINKLPLQDYDAFLYTSTYDGTPNTLIEIGLAGIPIISSAVGGVPALIGDYAGLVKDIHNPSKYADEFNRIYNNYAAAHKKAAMLRKKLADNHSEKNFTEEIQTLIQEQGR